MVDKANNFKFFNINTNIRILQSNIDIHLVIMTIHFRVNFMQILTVMTLPAVTHELDMLTTKHICNRQALIQIIIHNLKTEMGMLTLFIIAMVIKPTKIDVTMKEMIVAGMVIDKILFWVALIQRHVMVIIAIITAHFKDQIPIWMLLSCNYYTNRKRCNIVFQRYPNVMLNPNTECAYNKYIADLHLFYGSVTSNFEDWIIQL